MMFMNEWEIADAVDRFARDPVLGPAARYLRAFMHEVNAHSDGWPYWSPPCKAAGKLQELLHAHMDGHRYPQPAPATAADVKRCLSPIKAFMSRRGLAAGMKEVTLG